MPQELFPHDFVYEERRCPRCKKTKTFLRTDKRKYCQECLSYARGYKHRHKTLKLSKADIKQMEEENARKAREMSLKYGTTEPDCLTWRDQYSKEQKSDFLYNHINVCKDCMRYYSNHKRDSLDLNAGMNEVTDPLKGYEEVFAEPKPFPEDFIYYGGGVFPMNRMCPIHLCNLDENGKCSMCEKGCD